MLSGIGFIDDVTWPVRNETQNRLMSLEYRRMLQLIAILYHNSLGVELHVFNVRTFNVFRVVLSFNVLMLKTSIDECFGG